MNINYSIARQPATPEYVLQVFNDWHRQASSCGDADADFTITFDSKIDELCDAFMDDFFSWRRFASAMNKEWGIAISLVDWRSVLQPAKRKTVGGVCELIARKAIVPTLSPVSILGAPCMPAGAFLAVRSMLHDAGANASKIAPSTPLDEFTRRYWKVFMGPIAKLAPGALPKIKFDDPVRTFSVYVLTLGVILFLLSLLVSNPWVQIIAIALYGISLVSSWVVTPFVRPRRVTFGDLKTFKDLARVLADKVAI